MGTRNLVVKPVTMQHSDALLACLLGSAEHEHGQPVCSGGHGGLAFRAEPDNGLEGCNFIVGSIASTLYLHKLMVSLDRFAHSWVCGTGGILYLYVTVFPNLHFDTQNCKLHF